MITKNACNAMYKIASALDAATRLRDLAGAMQDTGRQLAVESDETYEARRKQSEINRRLHFDNLSSSVVKSAKEALERKLMQPEINPYVDEEKPDSAQLYRSY